MLRATDHLLIVPDQGGRYVCGRPHFRTDSGDEDPLPGPVLTASNIHYEVAAKTRGIGGGGIGAIHLLVRTLGLAEAIDQRLHLLKYRLPYHESDHVRRIAK
jgi:hypothetical protein